MGGSSTGQPKTTGYGWRAETKVYMASERTLINWLRTAATLGLGAIFSVVLLRYEYGGEITPGLGTGVASASSVGGFTNIHRAFLTLVS